MQALVLVAKCKFPFWSFRIGRVMVVLGAQQNVPAHIVAACKALLESYSPYIRTLRYAVRTVGLHFDLYLD